MNDNTAPSEARGSTLRVGIIDVGDVALPFGVYNDECVMLCLVDVTAFKDDSALLTAMVQHFLDHLEAIPVTLVLIWIAAIHGRALPAFSLNGQTSGEDYQYVHEGRFIFLPNVPIPPVLFDIIDRLASHIDVMESEETCGDCGVFLIRKETTSEDDA